MISTVINERYRIDSELGEGGMGTVYRAFDTLLERDVAIKVLHKEALGAKGQSRMMREALSSRNFVGRSVAVCSSY